MSHPQRVWLNRIVVICALVGLAIGVAAALFCPLPTKYRATAQVAMVAGTELTTAEASSYWEVLTQGQIPRTAAVAFSDPRWLQGAAAAAGVSETDLKLTAGAVPDTTLVSITADAPSAGAATAAVANLLKNATPEVGTISAPFKVHVVSQ